MDRSNDAKPQLQSESQITLPAPKALGTWKRWTFWACCIVGFSLLFGFGSAATAVSLLFVGLFYLACLQAIRWMLKWVGVGWPGRPKNGLSISTPGWLVFKGTLVPLFILSIWVSWMTYSMGEHRKLDQNNTMYTSVNGQVVMKYDASKWDIAKDEKINGVGDFRMSRKSNKNIQILIFSNLNGHPSLEEMAEAQKKQLTRVVGPSCVYKNSLADKNTSLSRESPTLISCSSTQMSSRCLFNASTSFLTNGLSLLLWLTKTRALESVGVGCRILVLRFGPSVIDCLGCSVLWSSRRLRPSSGSAVPSDLRSRGGKLRLCRASV
jgi:hypothetical protein